MQNNYFMGLKHQANPIKSDFITFNHYGFVYISRNSVCAYLKLYLNNLKNTCLIK